jgi:hypothetical protein
MDVNISTSMSNKFYYQNTIFVRTKQIIWIARTNMYTCQTNSTNYQNKMLICTGQTIWTMGTNMYMCPNKFYLLKICMYRTDYINCRNKYVHVSSIFYKLSKQKNWSNKQIKWTNTTNYRWTNIYIGGDKYLKEKNKYAMKNESRSTKLNQIRKLNFDCTISRASKFNFDCTIWFLTIKTFK